MVLVSALLASSLVGIGVGANPAGANVNDTIVVDSTGNGADSNPGDGICQTNNGNCTLRAAIETANARFGSDRIHFDISGSGTKTIDVNGQLPNIYDPTGWLEIDGYTQGDATPNTAAVGSNATIRIEIQGDEPYGLRITSAENVVRGLAISGFDRNLAIHFEAADGNRIAGNFIGPDADGDYVSGTHTGLQIWLGPDQNIIGGPALADRNVISGNGLRGLLVEQGNTSRNTIQNNVVGLNPSLSDRLTQRTGMDIQWGTWGNLIGGVNSGEGNLVSGNLQSFESNWGGIDLSHSSTGNLVIGNLIGTLGDGNSAADYTANTHGILIKDNARGNFFADNVIGNSRWDGIKHRHNFTDPNTWVENRIGVGADGAALPNGRAGIRLNGHGDLLHGNIIANNTEHGVLVVDETFNDSNTNYPPEQTLGNVLRYNTFYNNAGPQVDLAPVGVTANDPGDGDDGPHRLLNSQVFTGLGQGEVYGTACAGCEVQIYLSGPVNADGTVDIASPTVGNAAGWLGSALVDGNGRFSLADSRLVVGKKIWGLVIDTEGNTSEWATVGGTVVPATPYGIEGNPAPSLARQPRPATPNLPPAYVSILPGPFDCSHENGRLSWTDAGASTYYVFSTTGGVDRYLGGHADTSLAVADADSYRVTHWLYGRAISANCDFSAPAGFDCSVTNGVLSWTDAGASAYYVFSTTAGVDRYLGGHTGTTLNVEPADSFRVTHWLGSGPTRATCDGEAVTFDCSVSNGVLSWTDAGASAYYVFSTTGGVDQYLGGHAGTTLNVAAADSYRVTYWSGGSPTRATCS